MNDAMKHDAPKQEVLNRDALNQDALIQGALRQKRQRTLQKLLYGLGFPLLLLIVWEILAQTNLIDRRFFPPPTSVARTSVEILLNGTDRSALAGDLAVTLRRLGFGYVIGALGGVVAGVLMGLYAPVRMALGPTVYATFPMPKIAIFPLMIIFFGIGDGSKIALVALGVFYMTCINTLSGVLYAAPIYRDVGKAFQVPTWTRYMKIVIPSALPPIVAGLKLGLGQGLILVVSAEFVSANEGMGHFIWNAWQVLDIAKMFLGLVVVAVIGGAAVLLGDTAERKLIPWATH